MSFLTPLIFGAGFVFLELEVFVEFGGAVLAFGEEVEAYTTNMFIGTEILEIIHLLALNLEFHRAPAFELHLVTITKMTINNCGQTQHNAMDITCMTVHFACYICQKSAALA